MPSPAQLPPPPPVRLLHARQPASANARAITAARQQQLRSGSIPMAANRDPIVTMTRIHPPRPPRLTHNPARACGQSSAPSPHARPYPSTAFGRRERAIVSARSLLSQTDHASLAAGQGKATNVVTGDYGARQACPASVGMSHLSHLSPSPPTSPIIVVVLLWQPQV